jgi:hypothetical protein
MSQPGAGRLQSRFCYHNGADPVQVGPYQIHLGGLQYLKAEDLESFDVLVRLDRQISIPGGARGCQQVLEAFINDYQPPPVDYRKFLEEVLIPELAAGKKVLVFCIGSHGRTGTVLASLIALLEPDVRDPIKMARSRHCHKAVETYDQAKFVFDLRRQEVPEIWHRLQGGPPRQHTLANN